MLLLRKFLKAAANVSARVSAKVDDLVHTSILSNGIEIASQDRAMDKKLRFRILINAGSLEDPEGKEGVAHFLEHVLYGEKDVEAFKHRGGGLSAYTNPYEISVDGYIDNTPENRELMLDTIASILMSKTGAEYFIKQKERILNEIGMYGDKAEHRHAAIIHSIYKGRPDSEILGTAATVEAMTPEDLENYKRDWFKGQNIYIALTGVSDHKEIHNALETRLSSISNRPLPSRVMPHFPAGDIRHNPGNVQQLYFNFIFPVPPVRDNERFIVQIANDYLNSLVSKKIIEQEGVVYGASGSILTNHSREGGLGIDGNVRPANAHRIVPLATDILAQVCEEIDIEEFKTIKKNSAESFADNKNALYRVNHYVYPMTADLARVHRVPCQREDEELLEKVTPEDIRQYFSDTISKQLCLVVYGDDSKLHSYEEFERMLEEKRRRLRGMQPEPAVPAMG